MQKLFPYFLMLFLSLNTFEGYASETDQFYGKLTPLKDSQLIINTFINRALEKSIQIYRSQYPNPPSSTCWNTDKNGANGPSICLEAVIFAKILNHFLSGNEINGALEVFLTQSPAVDRNHPLFEIYTGSTFAESRLNSMVELINFDQAKPTINVGNIYLGIDKLDHFVSEGYKYFEAIHSTHKSRSSVLRGGESWEFNIYGFFASGVYSNADLVANYMGLIFYENVFAQYLTLNGNNKLILNKSFQIAPYLSQAMDESLNVNVLLPRLWQRVKLNLQPLCPEIALKLEQRFTPEQLHSMYPEIIFNASTWDDWDSVCNDLIIQ